MTPSIQALFALTALGIFALYRAPSWSLLWDELLRPSTAVESAYLRGVIAAGHVLLGAALVVLLPGLWLAMGRAAVALGYWLVKERGDLKRGGRLADGLEDALFVWFGALYLGPWWWPLIGLGMTGCVMLAGVRK